MGNQQVKERKSLDRRTQWHSAECPSPPGKPFLDTEVCEKYTDVIAIRWSPPTCNGGAPIDGYLVEHRRTGSPHWLRATPYLILDTKLPLTGLEPGWKYQFRVSAGNEAGFSSPSELSEPLIVTPQKCVAAAPFFNVPLQNKCGLENEKVEFKVQFIGVPPPKISWYKDGFEVFSSRKTKIVTEDDHSIFIIHQAALEDEGEIKCTATNRAGHAVTKAYLKLEAPPRIRLPRQYKDGLIFEKGESIRLKATIAGRPKPQVTWYHDGEILQENDRFEIVDTKLTSALKITDACRNDRGEYEIVGVNKIGEDSASFLVTVTDRPSAPGKVQTEVFERKVKLSWLPPKDDGGCKIGTYVVEYFRIGWDIWLKARNSRQLTTSIENLIEGSRYKFRVRAENPYGSSPPSEESDIVFIPDSKRYILEPLHVTKMHSVMKEINQPANELDHAKNDVETEKLKKRRLLEEKAQRLLGSYDKDSLLTENTKLGEKITSSNPETILFDFDVENAPPLAPRRKNKGRNRLKLNTDLNIRPTSISLSSIHSPRFELMNESSLTNDLEPERNFSDSSKKTFLELSKSNEMAPVRQEKAFNIESPLFPRETDDNEIHGSSELMLVIYPKDKSKSTELSTQYRSEIELYLKREGTAPPISLSSPELGCGDGFELPILRNAVSSTELLAEKTAARLYEDSIKEEIQSIPRLNHNTHKGVTEKRSDLTEGLMEKKYYFQEPIEPWENKSLGHITKRKLEKVSETSIDSFSSSGKISMTDDLRLSSINKERLEISENFSSTNSNKSSNIHPAKAKNSLKAKIEIDDDVEESNDEYSSANLAIEYDYANEKGVYIRNLVKSQNSYDQSIQNMLKPISPGGHSTHQERSGASSLLSKTEIKNNISYETLPLRKEETKEKTKKTYKILQKFGLRKDRKNLEVVAIDPIFPPPPKPILKNKIPPTKSKISSMKRLIPAKSIDKVTIEEESEIDTTGKKKKVRITEPESSDETVQPVNPSMDRNAEENQVLIYHYSDIVREFGGLKGSKPNLSSLGNVEKTKKPIKSWEWRESKATDYKGKNLQVESQEGETIDSKLISQNSMAKATANPNEKFRASLEYAIDVAMFLLACWLYFFKNELYAIPVLVIMVFKQLKDITTKNYKKLKNKFFNENSENEPKELE